MRCNDEDHDLDTNKPLRLHSMPSLTCSETIITCRTSPAPKSFGCPYATTTA